MNAVAVIDDYLDALLDCAPRALAGAPGAVHGDASAVGLDARDALDASARALHGIDGDAVDPAAVVPAAVDGAAVMLAAGESQALQTPVPAARALDGADLAAALLAEFDAYDAPSAMAASPSAATIAATLPASPASAADDADDADDADALAAALMAEFDACDAPPAAAAAFTAPAAVEAVVAATAPATVAARSADTAPTPTHQAQLALHAAISAANGHHVAANHRWIRVAVGHDSYALELLRVQEVVRVAPIVAMRGAGSCVLGVMNLRGRIVPVFDLGLWLGTACVQTDERSRIVVVERDDELIGVLVTAVDNVVTLGRERIEPPLPGSVPGAMVGIARVGPVPTVLLDANALFG